MAIQKKQTRTQRWGMYGIPYQEAYHPRKAGKVRVVFGCCAKYEGPALDDYLLTSPGFANKKTLLIL